jgi:hypothetical protein
MARMNFNNTFGAQNSNLDLQRVDLWKVTLELPSVLGGSSAWNENVEFALEKFPFPERSREMIQIKYMQQTNYLIGGDTPTPAIEIPVRYAFAQRTAEILEKWFWLVSNPLTGGVGLTTQVKGKGIMRWQVPNMAQLIADMNSGAQSSQNTMNEGLIYALEGCIIKGLRFADADMTQSGAVNLLFNLQIDRYYPLNVNDMQVVV